jgi:FkbM family methyltransferase
MNAQCSFEQWKKCRWGINWRWIAEPYTRRAYGGTIMEVGIGPLEISALPYFAEMGQSWDIIGIDPNPRIVEAARTALPYAKIIEKAVYSESGHTLQLTDNGGSSGLVGAWKPTEGGSGTFNVQTVAFADVDPGDILILNIDCEGAEHYVLQGLKSRPLIIGIELWPDYPKAGWCTEWLLSHDYRPIFETGPRSETQIWAV